MHGSVAHRSRSARENREKSQESQGHPRPLKVWDQRKLKTLPKDTISWRQRLTQPCLPDSQFEPSSKQPNWLCLSGAVKSAGTAQAQLVPSKFRAPLCTRKYPFSPQYSPQEFLTTQ